MGQLAQDILRGIFRFVFEDEPSRYESPTPDSIPADCVLSTTHRTKQKENGRSQIKIHFRDVRGQAEEYSDIERLLENLWMGRLLPADPTLEGNRVRAAIEEWNTSDAEKSLLKSYMCFSSLRL